MSPPGLQAKFDSSLAAETSVLGKGYMIFHGNLWVTNGFRKCPKVHVISCYIMIYHDINAIS